MNITNWASARSYTAAELEAMGAGWALIDGDVPERIFLCVVNGWAVAYWDGFGCDTESMPPNMLYVSGPNLIFAREWTDPSFEAVRDYLAGWDIDKMESDWNADSEKFESESGWSVVS